MAIVLIIVIIVAVNQQCISELSFMIMAAVILYNLMVLVKGYWILRWLG